MKKIAGLPKYASSDARGTGARAVNSIAAPSALEIKCAA
jgi:hypothetical protein